MAEVFDLEPVDADNVTRWPEGMLGGDINNAGRADEGMLARHYNDHDGSRTASGTSNAFAVTSSRTIAALFDNLTLVFSANHTITGAATLNLNGIGAKSIKRFNGNELTAGDIVSGTPVSVIYKLASDTWYMVSASAALFANTHADFNENATPGTPAANVARLFAQDDGSGNTVMGWMDPAAVSNFIMARATQAEVEAAASLFKSAPVGRQHFHPGHPKAGGNLNGTGTPAVAAGDYGLGAITDGGTGLYTFALDTAFANTNYWCNAWARAGTDSDPLIVTGPAAGTKTASSFQILVMDGDDSSANSDSAEIGITFWGDYA